MLIRDNKEALNTKELVAEQINAYLDKASLSLDSNNFTYAYQWGEWDFETKERHVSSPTISRTGLCVTDSGVRS